MQTVRIAEVRDLSATGRHVRLHGWVRTRRDSKGGFSFLEINDGSCLANIQVVADGELPNYASEITVLNAGCSVTIDGQVQASQGRGQATEIQATRIEVHGWADPQRYALQKKRHSFEKLRQWAHLRARTNTFGAVARVRNTLSRAIHEFFQQRGFLYLHTPIITASDCEGAGEMFKVTTFDLNDVPRNERSVDFTRDFFDRPAFLTVSGQLEAETYACALGKVYTFGPTFRAEDSNTSRHLAEFWMVEPEMAFFDLQDNMQLAEEFLRTLCQRVLADCQEDMEFFNARIDATARQKVYRVAEQKSFTRLAYRDAIQILQEANRRFEFEPRWGSDLQSEHERFLTEDYFDGPVIVFNYPQQIKPFYMRVNDDEPTVRAMDVLAPGVGEIIGGSQREERLPVLEDRMRQQQLQPDDYWWYLDLRRFGTVPHSGFGLGLERMMQFVTGMANIRDVIPFPRTPGSAEF